MTRPACGRAVARLAATAAFVAALLAAPACRAEGLTGEAALVPFTAPAREPVVVAVGIRIDQITGIEQQQENYGAVIELTLEWQDPKLAFTPEPGHPDIRLFKPAGFVDYAGRLETIVPAFVIRNQQSRRFIHLSAVALSADGSARYVEKSSLTLQAPHFDFRRFPFDRQTFVLELASLLPEHYVRFVEKEGYSGLGPRLGEEAWRLSAVGMQIGGDRGMSGRTSALAILTFEGTRHIQYYLIRIFLPMLVLITVSWSAFFFDEYRKRAEIAGANLLIFVAFNWAVSAELPKLGYLTFMDFILQWMFIVTGLLVLLNVGLSQLKRRGRGGLAQRIDRLVIRWIYPLGYAAIIGYGALVYLAPSRSITPLTG